MYFFFLEICIFSYGLGVFIWIDETRSICDISVFCDFILVILNCLYI